jgi:hypothetical protein
MSGGIFTGSLDSQCISMMLVYMLMFAMVWEYITTALQRKVEGNRAHSMLLTNVYKELMILGFIAFAVILAKEFGLQMSDEKMHCFEFCDLLVGDPFRSRCLPSCAGS